MTYLIQCNEDEITDSSLYRKKLREWLSSSKPEDVDYVSGFLRKVDSFNLDDYIRAIHFEGAESTVSASCFETLLWIERNARGGTGFSEAYRAFKINEALVHMQ